MENPDFFLFALVPSQKMVLKQPESLYFCCGIYMHIMSQGSTVQTALRLESLKSYSAQERKRERLSEFEICRVQCGCSLIIFRLVQTGIVDV